MTSIPSEFPRVLRAFTREVLRSQPDNIFDFGAEYFLKKKGLNPACDYTPIELIELVRSPDANETIFSVVSTINSLSLPDYQRYHFFSHLFVDNDQTHTVNLNFLAQELQSVLNCPPQYSTLPKSLHGYTEDELDAYLLQHLPAPLDFCSLQSFFRSSTFGFSTREQTFLQALFANTTDATTIASTLFSSLAKAYHFNALPPPPSTSLLHQSLSSLSLPAPCTFEELLSALESMDVPISRKQLIVAVSQLDFNHLDCEGYQSIIFDDVKSRIADCLLRMSQIDEIVYSGDTCLGYDFEEFCEIVDHKFKNYSNISRSDLISLSLDLNLGPKHTLCLKCNWRGFK
ncbi:hypothetical protein GEMRC1_007573 [Eukaryota sp. GEM-RC1]